VQPLLVCATAGEAPPPAAMPTVFDAVVDEQGLAARRFDARPGTCYLIRPDQHVAARWRSLDVARIRAALAQATCNV
jgi:3-(3-hydroxy-phenyl)propionate hydroxylase